MHVYCTHLHIPFPIKAIWEKGLRNSSLKWIATPFPTRTITLCLRWLILICGGWESSVGWSSPTIMCHSVFNVWPKTTLLLPVWPRDAKSLDTQGKRKKKRFDKETLRWGKHYTRKKKRRENNISIHYFAKDLKSDKEWLKSWHWYTLGQLTYLILVFSSLID